MSDDGDNIIPFPGKETSETPGAALAVRDPARQVARQLYLGLRSRAPNAATCLRQVMQALANHRDSLPTEAPPADAELLRVWSAEDDWEGRYRASRSVEILDAPGGDDRRFLADLQYQCEMAREILQRVTGELEGPPPIDYDVDKPWPSAQLLGRWDAAQRRWMGLQQEVGRVRERVVREDREATRSDYWEDELRRTEMALREHYAAGGPQYEALVRRLAALDVRLRQMERSGRDPSNDEYKTLHDLHLKYVTQLQRHTEATKSESVQPVQDAIKRIVSLLERRIKPVNPPLWGSVVEDIIAAVGETGVA